MNEHQLRRLFPNASKSTIALNSVDPQFHLEIEGEGEAGREVAVGRPKLERSVGHGALGSGQAQEGDSGRFLIRVTSVRRRLIDEDNLCEKYVVDCCRYAGLIPSDSPGTAQITATQRKAEKEEAEHTYLEIFAIVGD